MPRPCISNVLSCPTNDSDSHSDSAHIQILDATLLSIWRKAFPHLPSRFYPGWDYRLDDLAKRRSKAYRAYRKSHQLQIQEQHKSHIKLITRDIKAQVRQNKKQIIALIINEFAPLQDGSVPIQPCCISEPRNNAGYTHNLTGNTNQLTAIMNSDQPHAKKLFAIVDLVPPAHLTRRVGLTLIKNFPNLQLRIISTPDCTKHQDVELAINNFLDRYHRICHCAHICSQMQHACCAVDV